MCAICFSTQVLQFDGMFPHNLINICFISHELIQNWIRATHFNHYCYDRLEMNLLPNQTVCYALEWDLSSLALAC